MGFCEKMVKEKGRRSYNVSKENPSIVNGFILYV